MIKAVFNLNHTGEVVGFLLSGHAGTAESGQDILCAAVSGAVQCVNVIIEDALGLTGYFSVHDGEDNEITCDISSLENKTEAKLVLFGFMRTMEEWEKDFPKNIKLKKISV